MKLQNILNLYLKGIKQKINIINILGIKCYCTKYTYKDSMKQTEYYYHNLTKLINFYIFNFSNRNNYRFMFI